jgi:hypothetical protein
MLLDHRRLARSCSVPPGVFDRHEVPHMFLVAPPAQVKRFATAKYDGKAGRI